MTDPVDSVVAVITRVHRDEVQRIKNILRIATHFELPASWALEHIEAETKIEDVMNAARFARSVVCGHA